MELVEHEQYDLKVSILHHVCNFQHMKNVL
jgi:hypothetical protein